MPYQALPLDEEFKISSEDLTLLKRIIGIQDNVQLKQHLLEVQTEAYSVYPYPCIRKFDFARFKIAKHPAYESVIRLGKERKNAIFLDLPCCVGSDSRKLIADGYPRENVIVSDIHAEYWTIGHKLFKTTAETYPIPFLQGDIFAPNFLKPGVSPLNTSSQITLSPPSLTTLTSLTPLQHHVSVIYTSSFFHLFREDEQRKLAHLFASLLSPLPGSIIFGSQMGTSDAEDNNKSGRISRLAASMGNAFAHSPTSWREMWTGKDGPFTPEQVSIQIDAVRMERKDIARLFNLDQPCIIYRNVWSVTRTGS